MQVYIDQVHTTALRVSIIQKLLVDTILGLQTTVPNQFNSLRIT